MSQLDCVAMHAFEARASRGPTVMVLESGFLSTT